MKAKRKKTILVTGSAGFIGFHTAKKLLDKGYKVIGVDNLNKYYDPKLKIARNKLLKNYKNYKFYKLDLSDLKSVKKIFRENKIDKVCHLAAQAGVRYSLVNPQAYIQSNIVAFTNILSQAHLAQIKDFVYASSSSVYGENKKIPFSVKDRVDQPVSLYAATKRADELIAYTFHKLYGINCVGLRFFTVYGPFGRPDMAYFSFTKDIYAGKKIKLFNRGKMARDFTYIDDAVSAIEKSLTKTKGFSVLNVGNTKPVSLIKFLKILEMHIGKKAQLVLASMQPGDVTSTFADIRETRQHLGFKPTTDLNIGLNKFVKWYNEYYGK